MNSKNQFDDWAYEKLYDAIMKAISKSTEVRKVLEELENCQLTHKTAAINLILCLDELLEMARYSDLSKPKQYTDSGGKSEDFDDVRWMKQAQIKF